MPHTTAHHDFHLLSRLLHDEGRDQELARCDAPPGTHPRSALRLIPLHVSRCAAVANWTWTSEDDVCGICHMPLDGCAPGAIGPGDDSPVVWGKVRSPLQPLAPRWHTRLLTLPPSPVCCRSARTTFTSCASTRGCRTRTHAPSVVASGSLRVRRSRRPPHQAPARRKRPHNQAAPAATWRLARLD